MPFHNIFRQFTSRFRKTEQTAELTSTKQNNKKLQLLVHSSLLCVLLLKNVNHETVLISAKLFGSAYFEVCL